MYIPHGSHGTHPFPKIPNVQPEPDMHLFLMPRSQGLFINAACFDRIEYNPLSGESDPGINVYRLVRPLPQGEAWRAAGWSGEAEFGLHMRWATGLLSRAKA